MNPEIANHWNTAISHFNAAKISLKEQGTACDIPKKLSMAIVSAHSMISSLSLSGEARIASGIALETFDKFQTLTTSQAFEETLNALKTYRNLVPENYNLPIPTL